MGKPISTQNSRPLCETFNLAIPNGRDSNWYVVDKKISFSSTDVGAIVVLSLYNAETGQLERESWRGVGTSQPPKLELDGSYPPGLKVSEEFTQIQFLVPDNAVGKDRGHFKLEFRLCEHPVAFRGEIVLLLPEVSVPAPAPAPAPQQQKKESSGKGCVIA